MILPRTVFPPLSRGLEPQPCFLRFVRLLFPKNHLHYLSQRIQLHTPSPTVSFFPALLPFPLWSKSKCASCLEEDPRVLRYHVRPRREPRSVPALQKENRFWDSCVDRRRNASPPHGDSRHPLGVDPDQFERGLHRTRDLLSRYSLSHSLHLPFAGKQGRTMATPRCWIRCLAASGRDLFGVVCQHL